MSNIQDVLSFLNIQYAWESADQIVFFVPEAQYTDENVRKFDELKRDTWHLAIATNVYNIKDFRAEKLTFPIYLHGYYDLLLHGDYRVVPYGLQYPGKEQLHRMTPEEFKETFVFNERRTKLYKDFIKCLDMVKSCVEVSSVKIGGSFVEGKECPNDMDVLIFISAKEFEKIKNDKELYKKYQILTAPHLLENYGLELHVHVFAEEDVDLNSADIYNDYECMKYICERGYWASLYTNGHEVNNIRYLHNLIKIEKGD